MICGELLNNDVIFDGLDYRYGHLNVINLGFHYFS